MTQLRHKSTNGQTLDVRHIDPTAAVGVIKLNRLREQLKYNNNKLVRAVTQREYDEIKKHYDGVSDACYESNFKKLLSAANELSIEALLITNREFIGIPMAGHTGWPPVWDLAKILLMIENDYSVRLRYGCGNSHQAEVAGIVDAFGPERIETAWNPSDGTPISDLSIFDQYRVVSRNNRTY